MRHRIDPNGSRRRVANHVFCTEGARATDADALLAGRQLGRSSPIDRRLAGEGQAESRGGISDRADLDSDPRRLRERGGRIRIATHSPRRKTGLQYEKRLDGKPRRAPQHDVGQLPHLERTNLLSHTVGDCWIDRCLGEVAQDTLVVVATRIAAARIAHD